MDFLIGMLLIVLVAPLVGLAGRVLGNSGHEGLGKVFTGGYLAVLGVAGWLIIRSS